MDDFDPHDPGLRFFAGLINGLLYVSITALAIFLAWRYFR
jgi:hypothetical protein